MFTEITRQALETIPKTIIHFQFSVRNWDKYDNMTWSDERSFSFEYKGVILVYIVISRVNFNH